MNETLGINIAAVTDETIVRPLSSWNLITGKARILPSFLIAGVQKGGTTSLVQYLQQHPQLLQPQRKDVFFFNNMTRYDKGTDFYRSFFSLKIQQQISDIIRGTKTKTFDGTPNYLDSIGAPKRIDETLPNVKIVLLLRNPISRAYSNYNMALKFGFETLPFYEALMQEEVRVTWFEKSEYYKGHNFVYQRLAYKKRGEYATFLPDWINTFGDRLHIEFTENLDKYPLETYNRILKFLELDKQELDFKKYNEGTYNNKMDEKSLEYLSNYYKPFNEKLTKLLNRDLPW
ncbi:sulfotransferase domain-containing protein [soil metagenome]